jgi:hypothetical protein
MPQSGPIPVPAQPHPAAAVLAPQPLYPPPAPPPSSSKKPMVLAIVAVVVLLVAAAITIPLVINSKDSGGSGGSGGGGSVSADKCADKTPDSKGFSKCMRTLAAPVLESSDCQSGIVMPGGSGNSLPAPGATAATCKLSGGYTIFYYHFASPEIAAQNVDVFLGAFQKSKSEAETGNWEGGGLKGKYYAVDVGSGIGAMLFTVDNSPLMGTLLKLSTGGSSGQSLTDYFNEHVKPGSS